MPPEDNLSFEPKGFRDVYWCWILNEPVILTWEGDHAMCPGCDWIDRDSDDKATRSAVFLTQHQFVCHVRKPRDV